MEPQTNKVFRIVAVALAALALGAVVLTSTGSCGRKPKPDPFIGGTKVGTLFDADVGTLTSDAKDAAPSAQ